MTHFVTDRCVKCKYTDCVVVCPVDCFYEGNNMLVIDPEQCIDCGVCVPECPADAIVSDEFMEDILSCDYASLNPEQQTLKTFHKINEIFSKKWPNVTCSSPHVPEADSFKSALNKTPLFRENVQEDELELITCELGGHNPFDKSQE